MPIKFFTDPSRVGHREETEAPNEQGTVLKQWVLPIISIDELYSGLLFIAHAALPFADDIVQMAIKYLVGCSLHLLDTI